jgi:hypothetical protein
MQRLDEWKTFKSLAKFESNLTWLNSDHRFIWRDIKLLGKLTMNKLACNFEAPDMVVDIDIANGISINIEGP